jgi:EAL domain-containing protein (putative c-di-GMP-specific phosphodiesterase class I)
VDRSFVQNMTVEPGSAAVVGAVIAMAQSLDLDVVAEGVETSEQRDFLHDRQCHQAQGFYFSRPVPMAEIPRLLAVIGAQGRSPDDPKPGEGGSAADGKRTLLVAIGKS